MKEMAGQADAGSEDKCPVDHKTRELWLQQAKQAKAAQEAAAAAGGGSTTPSPENAFTTPVVAPPAAPAAVQQPPATIPKSQIPQPAQQTVVPAALPSSSQPSSSSWSSWIPFSGSSSTATTSAPAADLGEHREISSIPRAATTGPSACPSNAEQETGADTATGNWVYPSEKQFYEAMKRKGHDGASAADMKTVVPIHNAVNERAWAEILRWEKPFVEGCGCAEGPKLQSFMGESKRMTPKARLNTLLGYTAPFDRHDWIVDRCGTRVDYVIDFYAGRNNDKAGAGKLNFYLDVRPKFNTWEGVKMRALRAVGLN